MNTQIRLEVDEVVRMRCGCPINALNNKPIEESRPTSIRAKEEDGAEEALIPIHKCNRDVMKTKKINNSEMQSMKVFMSMINQQLIKHGEAADNDSDDFDLPPCDLPEDH